MNIIQSACHIVLASPPPLSRSRYSDSCRLPYDNVQSDGDEAHSIREHGHKYLRARIISSFHFRAIGKLPA